MSRELCVIVLASMLFSCATKPTVVGPYSSHVSAADLQQLKLLVRSDPNLDHRLVQVDAISPQRVRVKVGGPNRGEKGSNYTTLGAIKRGGKWKFDPKAGVESEGTVFDHG
jgi:hypothetical protein